MSLLHLSPAPAAPRPLYTHRFLAATSRVQHDLAGSCSALHCKHLHLHLSCLLLHRLMLNTASSAPVWQTTWHIPSASVGVRLAFQRAVLAGAHGGPFRCPYLRKWGSADDAIAADLRTAVLLLFLLFMPHASFSSHPDPSPT